MAITVVIFDPEARWRRPVGPVVGPVAAMAVIAVLLGSRSLPASAHDPGQGTEVTAITLRAESLDQRIEITAIPEEPPREAHGRTAGLTSTR